MEGGMVWVVAGPPGCIYPLPPPDYKGWLHTNPPAGKATPYHLPGGNKNTLTLLPKAKGTVKPKPLNLEVGLHMFRRSGMGAGYFLPKRLKEDLWSKKPWTCVRRRKVLKGIISPPDTTQARPKKVLIDKHIRWWTRRSAYVVDSPKPQSRLAPVHIPKFGNLSKRAERRMLAVNTHSPDPFFNNKKTTAPNPSRC